MTDDRQEPLSSEEMIERAQGGRTESSEDLLRQAKESVSELPEIEGLSDITIDIPVADEFPEPIPEIQTGSRPRRVRRQPTQIPHGPISSDAAPKVAVFAAAMVILLIAIGVFVAIAVSTTP